MKYEPFYAAGLKFSCKRCSACCRYDAGYVYITEKDLDALCGFLEMDRDSFIKVYCRWIEDREGKPALSLKEKPNKDCVFWKATKEGEGCIVYNFRPLQCKSFPFWDHILASENNWKIASSGCPGMNTGNLFTKEAVEEKLRLNGLEPVIRKKTF